MKIMVVMGEYPPEEGERRRHAVLKCASTDTEIGLAVINATFFLRSNSQVNSLSAGPLVAQVAQQAESDGYDPVVLFGTLDAGVELARNLVRIPVVGAGQSVLHLGAQLSNRLGMIAYEEKSIPFMRKQMHARRVADSVVGIRSVQIPLPESTKNRAAMRERFIQVARELIDTHDAEIVVPMGVTMVPVQYSPQLFRAIFGEPNGSLFGSHTLRTEGGIDAKTGKGKGSSFWFYSAAAAEVEVDAETGKVRVLKSLPRSTWQSNSSETM